jgi:hypothetical protein
MVEHLTYHTKVDGLSPPDAAVPEIEKIARQCGFKSAFSNHRQYECSKQPVEVFAKVAIFCKDALSAHF